MALNSGDAARLASSALTGAVRPLRAFLLLPLLLTAPASICTAATSHLSNSATPRPVPSGSRTEPPPVQVSSTLAAGESPREREISGGDTHTYVLSLRQGQYVRVLAEQHGINLALRLFDPQKRLLVEMDAPGGASGPEYVSAIAAASGEYTLAVKSLEEWANPGRYEVVIEELREATADDQKRVAAERAFADGQQLLAKTTKESRQAALAKFSEALSYWTNNGDRHWQTATLYSVCATRRRLGGTEAAAKCFDEALAFPLEDHDWRLRATLFNDRGLNLSDLGRPEEALSSLHDALALYKQRQDRKGQASALNNIGLVYARTGRMAEAIKLYEEAVPLRRAENDRAGEVNIYNNIGGFYDYLGEPQRALENYDKALQVWRELDEQGRLTDRDKLGAGFNNVAVAYDRLGQWQQALEAYKKALGVFEQTGNTRVEASTLDNLGELYMVLGDQASAEANLDAALKRQREKVKDPEATASVLTHAGQLSVSQGKLSEALSAFREALALGQTKGGRASALTNLGAVLALQGRTQEAMASYKEALELRRDSKDRRGEAITLQGRGEALAAGGDRAQALSDFGEALRLWRALEDKRGEASSLLGLARVERDGNNLADAARHSGQALSIIESLRTRVASQRLRTFYFATNQDYYETYIDVQMRLYESDRSRADLAAAAFQASEKARARSLIDALGEAGVDIRAGVSLELLKREREIQQRIDAKGRAKSEYKYTKEQAAALDKEIDGLIAEYDDVLTKIRLSSPNAAHLIQPQVQGLPEIQGRLLDDDTLLLEFHLGQERSYLWAVTNTSVSGYSLPKREVIEEAAKRLYGMLTAPEPAAEGGDAVRRARITEAKALYSSQATTLSQMLLGHVAGQLGKKRLLVVSDGVLQYLPFGALPVPVPAGGGPAAGKEASRGGAPYLIEEHEIVSLPSASVLAVLRNMQVTGRRAPFPVLVLADPVFDKNDSRLQQTQGASAGSKPQVHAGSHGEFSRPGERGVRSEVGLQSLVLTGREAAKIREVAGPGTQIKDGFDASRATLAHLAPGQYRIIHFSTHGLFDDEHPELSGIELSKFDSKGEPQDGTLRLQDIYNLRLPAEMVVLSACSTGLGKMVKGEGLVGLTRGFMYAGSPRVVASLWRVDEAATVELMQRFYRLMLKEGRTPPAALRQAQTEMLRDKRWSLPYFWAAFLIQGDWRAIN
jgi:CHAT domain-containing protein/tetratricopeptide (TPR) repeat protein